MSLSPFEIFSETPRPYIDPEKLKSKFLALSASFHPDRVHHLSEEHKSKATQDFLELNKAYQVLKEPKERLQVLFREIRGYSMERIQGVPSDMIEFSFQLGQFCKNICLLLDESNETKSSLMKANQMIKKKTALKELEAFESQLVRLEQNAENKLRDFDQVWTKSSKKEDLLKHLEEFISFFSYLSRWQKQLSEQSVGLKML
jgi:curved DNA-binding protein CbpA